MTKQKKQKSMKSIYMLGFPINISLEILIQLVSLIIPVFIIIKSLNTANILIVVIALLISLYIYPFTILLVAAIFTRFLPKPALGKIKTPGDELKYQTLIALNTFVRRTPARWLINIPFPGHLFYKICGTKIDSSALITFSDSLPDPYLVSIGKNSLLGWGCLVLGHYAPTPSTLFLGKVKIGNNVLVGAEAIVWPNVKICDGSIVQNKAVVIPGTIIPPNEIWGGIPAKKIKNIEENFERIPLSKIEEIEQYIQKLLLDNYKLQSIDKNKPLLSIGLDVNSLIHLLRKIQSNYDNLFIDVTRIDIKTFSFNDILTAVDKWNNKK